jgi:HNH endonuclease
VNKTIIDPEIVARLVEEYVNGTSTIVLGKKYGIHYSTVRERLLENGIVMRPSGRRKTEIPIGTRFGLLVTTSETFTVDRFGQPLAHVQTVCDCGNTYLARVHGLRHQGQGSCGCQVGKESTRICGLPDCNDKHFGLDRCKEHYLDLTREEQNAKHRDWMHTHREAKRTYKARRRMRSRAGMDSCDIDLSISYRQAIANDLCFYCARPAEHTDHFFPLAKGGTDHWWNLVRSCRLCNQHKHDRCGTWFQLR